MNNKMNGIDSYITISEGRMIDNICYVCDRDGKISGAESETLRDIAGTIYGRIHDRITVVSGSELDKAINNARDAVVEMSRLMRDGDAGTKEAGKKVQRCGALLDKLLKECSMN